MLDDLTDQIAAGFVNRGIKRGERVAIFLDNCPEFVISYYSILKAGAVALPVNYMFKLDEASYILQDAKAVALITSRVYLSIAEELKSRVSSLRMVITTTKTKEEVLNLHNLRTHNIDELRHIHPGPDELAVLLYTSGTMGFPKGAMLSHRNLISNAFASDHAARICFKDSVICLLPLFHSFAATVCMNMVLAAGAKMVIMKSLKPFKRILRAVRNNRVTIFVGIPSLYNILRMVKLPRIVDSPLIRFFIPLRLCISGAAALPPETFFAFEKRFRVPLLEGYGLTEASPVVTLNPLGRKRKAGSLGLAICENIKLKIVDDHDKPVKTGEVGELLVKGPNVMQGYFNQKQETEASIKDGWLYTGDMAKFDSDGYVYIAGRKKEMINVRGLNVYPREIEDLLYKHPAVKEAAVIGIEDTHKGEVPKAFVVLQDHEKATESEIINFLREKLAPYKTPKYVEFRASLPKNTTGKILKRLIKEEEDAKPRK
jgi:long-chain acyl-CoA synthetase